MKKKTPTKKLSRFSKSVGEGLQLAAASARRTAQIHGTPLCGLKDGKVVEINPYTGDLVKSESMKPKLPPPEGYSSWLDYATRNMDTRSLYNELRFGEQKQWPKGTTREEMRKSARAELAELSLAVLHFRNHKNTPQKSDD